MELRGGRELGRVFCLFSDGSEYGGGGACVRGIIVLFRVFSWGRFMGRYGPLSGNWGVSMLVRCTPHQTGLGRVMNVLGGEETKWVGELKIALNLGMGMRVKFELFIRGIPRLLGRLRGVH